MKKLKKALSLSLALVLSLALAVPAFAAGTTETVVDEKHGVTITMNGFLRKETNTYMCWEWSDGVNDHILVPTEMTFYVLADGSTVKVEANSGVKYTQFEKWSDEWFEFNNQTDFENNNYAWNESFYYLWDREAGGFFSTGNGNYALDGAETDTVKKTPEDMSPTVNSSYSIAWIGESDFAELVPVGGQSTAPTQPEQPSQPTNTTTVDDSGAGYVTFSDVVSQKTVNSQGVDVPLVTVKAGTTITVVVEDITVIPNPNGHTFMELYIKNDGSYWPKLGGKSFSTGVKDGVPYVLSESNIGLWRVNLGEFSWGICVNVVPDDGTTPTQPEQPAKKLAKAADQNITIDGKAVAFQTYVLHGTNYVKLRDIAHVLNGTGASFSVDYDNQKKSISLSSGKAYQDTGAEMSTPFAGANKEYNRKNLTIIVNGSPVELDALSMKDDSGNGYTYFKLRDLGSALGFNVSWTAEKGVYIESDKPYVG